MPQFAVCLPALIRPGRIVRIPFTPHSYRTGHMADSNYREFGQSETIRRNGTFMLIKGVLAILWAVGGLALALMTDVSQFAMHAMTTVPTIVGFNLITSGLKMRKGAERIVLSAKGVLLETAGETKLTPWSELAWAKVETVGMARQKTLRIYNTESKVAIEIGESVEDFQELCQAVIGKVGDKQVEVGIQVGKTTTRRNAIIMLTAGLLMGAAAIALAFDQRRNAEAVALLHTQGQPAKAEIVEHLTAPNGRTRRIKYRVTPEGPIENVEVEPLIWLVLSEARQVDVLTVPGRPEISRLVLGQKDDRHGRTPLEEWIVLIGLSLFSVVMIAFGLFSWFGWDISTADKTKRMRVTRYGQPVW